ncbi:bifunctional nicotinamidase/pyrazinamidase [Caenispirillum bisanense]|uniref:bifunctional nicotinamidase/pyrazinamidase n=1 Tax=Caenispirillum bisanense TaxID=414052 RepID=UPI0031D3D974
MPAVPLSPAADALLVIDVQVDFCPGGALAVPEGDRVVPLCNRLMAQFSTVVLTQDWHPAGHASFASVHGRQPFEMIELDYGPQVLWPDHCVQATAGAAFHPALDTAPAQLIVRKGMRRQVDSYSAFFENDRRTPTGLAGWLRDKGIRRVFLCGLATDYCVNYSGQDARALGFEAVLVEDACRAVDLGGSLTDALATLQAAGVTFARTADITAA